MYRLPLQSLHLRLHLFRHLRFGRCNCYFHRNSHHCICLTELCWSSVLLRGSEGGDAAVSADAPTLRSSRGVARDKKPRRRLSGRIRDPPVGKNSHLCPHTHTIIRPVRVSCTMSLLRTQAPKALARGTGVAPLARRSLAAAVPGEWE